MVTICGLKMVPVLAKFLNPKARLEIISILVWKPSVMPLLLVKRHMVTMGSNHDSKVLAKALSGLS